MLTKRAATLLMLFLVTTLAIGATPWLLFSHAPRFTEAQAMKIKSGMTEAEVIAVVGTASGSYTTYKAVYVVASIDLVVPPETKYDKSWCDDHGMIEVGFDDNGKATYRQFCPNMFPPLTFWERVKGWFAWQ